MQKSIKRKSNNLKSELRHTTKKEKKKHFSIVNLIGTILLLVGIIVVITAKYKEVQTRKGWTATTAEVVGYENEEESYDETYYRLVYTYEIDGKQYVNTGGAKSSQKTHRTGDKITIWYNPKDKNESVAQEVFDIYSALMVGGIAMLAIFVTWNMSKKVSLLAQSLATIFIGIGLGHFLVRLSVFYTLAVQLFTIVGCVELVSWFKKYVRKENSDFARELKEKDQNRRMTVEKVMQAHGDKFIRTERIIGTASICLFFFAEIIIFAKAIIDNINNYPDIIIICIAAAIFILVPIVAIISNKKSA